MKAKGTLLKYRRRQPGRPARLPGCERAARRKRNPPWKKGNSSAAWQGGGRVHFFSLQNHHRPRRVRRAIRAAVGAAPRLAASGGTARRHADRRPARRTRSQPQRKRQKHCLLGGIIYSGQHIITHLFNLCWWVLIFVEKIAFQVANLDTSHGRIFP